MDVKVEPHSHYLLVHVSGEYEDTIPEEGQPVFIAEACREHHLTRILIDARELGGNVSTMARFWRGKAFAEAFWGSAVRTAVVGSTEQVQTPPYFETVARNRGGRVRVLTDFGAALEWLLE